MKKSLEAELMSIAHRILQLKNRADIHELKAVTGVLYEKLSVLSFAEKHFEGPQPTIGRKQVMEALEAKEDTQEHPTRVIAEPASEANKDIVAEVTSESEETSVVKNPRPDGTEHQTEDITEPAIEKIKDIVAEMPSEPKEAPSKTARPDGTEHQTDDITEPAIEKIKDIVAEMPPESLKVDEVLEEVLNKEEEETKNDFRNVGVHYDDLPEFEPVPKKSAPVEEEKQPEEQNEPEKEIIKEREEPQQKEEVQPKPKPKEQQELFDYKMPEFERKERTTRNETGEQKRSLNDRLKKGINIGLNDRLAYIKHLFEGNAADYNRVLSQLNTIDTFPEAKRFIEEVIKPDYNNWENKELYEARFLQAIENKYL